MGTQIHQFAQKAFITRGDKVLVAHKGPRDPYNPGRWEVPGGRMDFGEDVDTHIQREVREETGLAIKPGAPFYIWQWVMHGPDDDGIQVQVVAVARECEATADEVSIANQKAGDCLDEVKWVLIADLLRLDLIPSLVPAAREFVARHGNQRTSP